MKKTLASRKMQVISSTFIAIFFILMTVSQMINENLKKHIIITNNKIGEYSSWYQSKSIKQILKENQLDYLETFACTKNIPKKKLKALNTNIEKTKRLVLKYEAEKTELLVGSANIPRAYWAQDLDGKMGAIVGLNEWKNLSRKYEIASRKFDLVMVLFQISIMLGVVCILIRENLSIQKIFTLLMVSSGLLATLMAIYSYTIVP